MTLAFFVSTCKNRLSSRLKTRKAQFDPDQHPGQVKIT